MNVWIFLGDSAAVLLVLVVAAVVIAILIGVVHGVREALYPPTPPDPPATEPVSIPVPVDTVELYLITRELESGSVNPSGEAPIVSRPDSRPAIEHRGEKA